MLTKHQGTEIKMILESIHIYTVIYMSIKMELACYIKYENSLFYNLEYGVCSLSRWIVHKYSRGKNGHKVIQYWSCNQRYVIKEYLKTNSMIEVQIPETSVETTPEERNMNNGVSGTED